MVTERLRRLIEDKLTIKDTHREEYWNRIIMRLGLIELQAMRTDIKLVDAELGLAKREGDKAAEKELEDLLKLKERDERLLSAIIVEARRILADERVELKEEKKAERE